MLNSEDSNARVSSVEPPTHRLVVLHVRRRGHHIATLNGQRRPIKTLEHQPGARSRVTGETGFGHSELGEGVGEQALKGFRSKLHRRAKLGVSLQCASTVAEQQPINLFPAPQTIV